MKTGKEMKTNSFKEFNVVYGSVDNKNPKAVYINISSWLEPLHDGDINYNRAIRNINKKLKQSLYAFDSSGYCCFIKDRTIVDLDIRESGIRFGKRSFMNCEVTLFSTIEIPVNDDSMKETMMTFIEHIIDDVLKKNEYFSFNKKKK
jgi:hypothetical protein